MRYVYENAQGERRDVCAPMTSPPPACVRFTTDHEWEPHCEAMNFDGREPELVERFPDVWLRVWHSPQVCTGNDGSVRAPHQRVPLSLSMPPTAEAGKVVSRYGQNVRQLANGTYATMQGRRIVDSKASRAAHAQDCGYVVDD